MSDKEPIQDVIEDVVDSRKLAPEGEYKVVRDQIIAVEGGWLVADVHSTPRFDIPIKERGHYNALAMMKSYNAVPLLIAEIERLRGVEAAAYAVSANSEPISEDDPHLERKLKRWYQLLRTLAEKLGTCDLDAAGGG